MGSMAAFLVDIGTRSSYAVTETQKFTLSKVGVFYGVSAIPQRPEGQIQIM